MKVKIYVLIREVDESPSAIIGLSSDLDQAKADAIEYIDNEIPLTWKDYAFRSTQLVSVCHINDDYPHFTFVIKGYEVEVALGDGHEN